MKCKSYILALMLASAATAIANSNVQWLNPDYDFGAIAEADGVASGQLRFVNSGDKPFSIISVHTSCGCTTANIPRDPILPGDTAVITVNYDPTGRPGKFEKKVTVNFSDEALSPRASLRIHGVVIGTPKTLQSRYPVDAGIMRLHSSVIPFGDVRRNTAKSDFVEIYNASTDTISPIWSNIPPFISVAPLVNVIPPGQQAVYNLMFSGYRSPLYGLVADSLFVAPDNVHNPVKIDIMGVVVEDFSNLTPQQRADAPVIAVSDSRLDFGSFSPDSPVITRQFSISNKGKNPLILRRVYASDPAVDVKVDKDSVKKGKHAVVSVTLRPDALADGILDCRIHIISNDPEQSSIVVRAVGIPDNF